MTSSLEAREVDSGVPSAEADVSTVLVLLEVFMSFAHGGCWLLEPLKEETEELLRVGKGMFTASDDSLDEAPSS